MTVSTKQMPKHTQKLIQPANPITFKFQGKRYSGFEGDTIASALFRAGVRVFSRSFKYHRPRGLMTLDGSSPNDLVQVNGSPNVHASTTPLEPDMEVQGQNAWPSLKLDIMSIFDALSPFLPVGFYYKTFIRPRAFWPLYETLLRNAAGLGKINPRPSLGKRIDFEKTNIHAEITVIGGGPAGLSAALAAAKAGSEVILIEQNPWLGGHLRYQTHPLPKKVLDHLPLGASDDRRAYQIALLLAEAVRSQENIRVMTHTTAFGGYADNLLGLVQGNQLIKLHTAECIVASGRTAQPLVFQNNDLPGIFLGDGVQRLINLYDVRPGKRAVVVTDDDQGWRAARDLIMNEVEVALLADHRHHLPESDMISTIREAGVPIRQGWTAHQAKGKRKVTGVEIRKIEGERGKKQSQALHIPCDTLVITTGYAANNELLYQLGSHITYDPRQGQFVPQKYPPGVWGAGHATGTRGIEAVVLEGQITGMEAAASLGHQPSHPDLQTIQDQLPSRSMKPGTPNSPPPTLRAPGKKKFLCFCEDVTLADMKDAVKEGFDGIQTLKRYSTISMGPTQGKICTFNTINILAHDQGQTIKETGTTTSRPPVSPVKLGVLAGRRLDPIRRTPMHHIHRQHGAKMMNAGAWKRPEDYGDPEGEALAVRQSVGMIDVSTLGKMQLTGPDASELINRLYTSAFHTLRQYQLRYGLMCTEAGIILDDGILGKVGENTYYLTTTSGGAEGIYEWMKWWRTVWDLDVHIMNLTSTYAALNLAGPDARKLLAGLTEIDLSPTAFPYLQMRQGQVAGVPARLLRIGFVGELGYEIHYPAYHGPQLWNVIMDQGHRFDISPFGIEAQRILRLEKQHILIGQDTNALSNPFAANLGWAVDLDKESFIGKPALERHKDSSPGAQLVGFRMKDPQILPGEGDQMVDEHAAREQGHPLVGRVTSARFSPTLEASIGMGWVKKDKTMAGTEIHIRVGGERQKATVVRKPFYDPQGDRVRM